MRLAGCNIPDREIEIHGTHASGPGGQNVNKVSTAIQLRFDIGASSLPAEYKDRLLIFNDQRISSEGVIVIKAQRYRSRELNRRDALLRLEKLVARGLHMDKPRKPTRPTAASRRRRVDNKKARSRVKSLRGTTGLDDR